MLRFACMILVAGLLSSCGEKKNPNLDPPPQYDGKPAKHHKFDGGVSDPHSQEKSEEGGGEK